MDFYETLELPKEEAYFEVQQIVIEDYEQPPGGQLEVNSGAKLMASSDNAHAVDSSSVLLLEQGQEKEEPWLEVVILEDMADVDKILEDTDDVDTIIKDTVDVDMTGALYIDREHCHAGCSVLSFGDGSHMSPAERQPVSLVQLDNLLSVSDEAMTIICLNQSDMHECHVCGQALTEAEQLEHHLASHQLAQEFACQVCGCSFSDSEHMETHLQMHQQQQPYKCQVCGVGFFLLESWTQHSHQHSEDNSFQCDVCGLYFAQLSNLQAHANQHLDGFNKQLVEEKPYRCEVCGVCFSVSSYLKVHMRKHMQDTFQCKMCGDFFLGPLLLKEHSLVHAAELQTELDPSQEQQWLDITKSENEDDAYTPVLPVTFLDLPVLSQTGWAKSRQHQSRFLAPPVSKQKNPKRFLCNICGAGFTQSVHVTVHQRIHTGERPYVCDICGKSFSVASNLKSHQKRHTDNVKNACSVCGLSFINSSSLKRHIQSHSAENSEQQYLVIDKQDHDMCDICGQSFSQTEFLEKHRKLHDQEDPESMTERPHPCHVCGTRFKTLSHLNVHTRIHTGEKPYGCDICGVRFAVSCNLKTHKQKKHGVDAVKVFQCKLCEQVFSNNSRLWDHMRDHGTGSGQLSDSTATQTSTDASCDSSGEAGGSRQERSLVDDLLILVSDSCVQGQLDPYQVSNFNGEKMSAPKPFKCGACGASFTQLVHLTVHQRIHTGEKPYTCDICGKSFAVSSNFKSHRKLHTEDRSYVCNTCGLSFINVSSLKKHTFTHVGENPSQEILKTRKTRGGACDICGQTFSRAYLLEDHIKEHSSADRADGMSSVSSGSPAFIKRPFTCLVCAARFRSISHLNVHKRIHSGEKPYTCDLCGVSFTVSCNLKSHKKKKHGIDSHKLFKCKMCHESFSSSFMLKNHQKVHMGDSGRSLAASKLFFCDICGAGFTQSVHVKVHKRSHTGERPYQCDLCGKSFSVSCNLKSHRQRHTAEKSHMCNICGLSFLNSASLRKHAGTHGSNTALTESDQKSFMCDICGHFFSRFCLLKTHYKSHPEAKFLPTATSTQTTVKQVKPFLCHLCGQHFPASSPLILHMKKKHGCQEGPKFENIPRNKAMESSFILKEDKFIQSEKATEKIEGAGQRAEDSLHDHCDQDSREGSEHVASKLTQGEASVRVCRDETRVKKSPDVAGGSKSCAQKAFSCCVCGAAFTQSVHVKVHQRIHTGEKPYRCRLCGRGFSVSCNLKAHLTRHESQECYQCDTCGARLLHLSSLKKHLQAHLSQNVFSCSFCGLSFSDWFHLVEHQKSHTSSFRKDDHILSYGSEVPVHDLHSLTETVNHKDQQSAQNSVISNQNVSVNSLERVDCKNDQSVFLLRQQINMKDSVVNVVEAEGDHGSAGVQVLEKKETDTDLQVFETRPRDCAFQVCLYQNVKQKLQVSLDKNVLDKSSLHKQKNVQKQNMSGPVYRCDLCCDTFTKVEDSDLHRFSHTGVKPYKCRQCGTSFATSLGRRLHSCQQSSTSSKDELVISHQTCGVISQQDMAIDRSTHKGNGDKRSPKDKMFMCDICGSSFEKLSFVKPHLAEHLTEKPYRCQVCGLCFTKPHCLAGHKKMHMRNKCSMRNNRPIVAGRSRLSVRLARRAEDRNGSNFKTKYLVNENSSKKTSSSGAFSTYRKLSSRSSLDKMVCSQSQSVLHMKVGTRGTPVLGAAGDTGCAGRGHQSRGHQSRDQQSGRELCGTSFKQAGHRPFQCDFCGAGFKQAAHLKAHVYRHTGEKPYTCKVCGVGFTVSSNLTVHTRIHTGERPYSCHICSKGFINSYLLKEHQRSHAGETGPEFCGDKPHMCQDCGARFRLVSHLKVHRRIHTGERPFMCHVCGRGFTVKCNLQTHLMNRHEEPIFGCQNCDKTFSSPVGLKQHAKTCHLGDKRHTKTCHTQGKNHIKICPSEEQDQTKSCSSEQKSHTKTCHPDEKKSFSCTTCGHGVSHFDHSYLHLQKSC